MIFLYEILRTKNSEAVSLLTWMLSAFTNSSKIHIKIEFFSEHYNHKFHPSVIFFFSARIFTVFVDSADLNLLANFTISTFLSSSVLVAAWYYKKKQNVE